MLEVVKDVKRRRQSAYVIPTSVPVALTDADGKEQQPQLAKKTNLLRTSSDEMDLTTSRLFHKRLYGLLFLQYSTILLLNSPFALLDIVANTIQTNHTLHFILECISIGGIVITMVTAITYGSKYPITQICLCSITIFVALELGISFADGSMGVAGYIAIGQATVSFAIILALLQFDLDWLDYPAAFILCFIAALCWFLLLLEVGQHTIVTSFGIAMGGYVFVCLVLAASYAVEKHVSPDEYVLATLFILCPEALLCIGAKSRYVDEGNDGGDDDGEAGERKPLISKA